MNHQKCQDLIRSNYEALGKKRSMTSYMVVYDSMINMSESCKEFYDLKRIRDTLEVELNKRSCCYFDTDTTKHNVIVNKKEWIRKELYGTLPYTTRFYYVMSNGNFTGTVIGTGIGTFAGTRSIPTAVTASCIASVIYFPIKRFIGG